MNFLNHPKRPLIFLLLSSVFCALAHTHHLILLVWILFVPILYNIFVSKNSKKDKYDGFVFGGLMSLLGSVFLINAITSYTDGDILMGIISYISCSILFSIYYGCLFLMIHIIHQRFKLSYLHFSIVVISLFGITEWIMTTLMSGIPWVNIQTSRFMIKDMYFTQLASIGGSYLLSMMIIIANLLFTNFLLKNKLKNLVPPIVFILAFWILGFGIFKYYETHEAQNVKQIKVTIQCEQLAPEEKWNQENGKQLVENLLRLNTLAAKENSELVLWTESAVPWTYKEDDDFIKEIKNINSKFPKSQIIGMNTDNQGQYLFNSAYLLDKNNNIIGKYDKQNLLSLVEEPLTSINIPFINGIGFSAKAGPSDAPLLINDQLAGVIICNESLLTNPTIQLAKDGATFFLCLSNDGWLSKYHFLLDQHFYQTRLRAIENRRDAVISANLGYSGNIKSSGKYMKMNPKDGFVKTVDVNINSELTFYTKFSNWTLYLYLGLFVGMMGILIFRKK